MNCPHLTPLLKGNRQVDVYHLYKVQSIITHFSTFSTPDLHVFLFQQWTGLSRFQEMSHSSGLTADLMSDLFSVPSSSAAFPQRQMLIGPDSFLLLIAPLTPTLAVLRPHCMQKFSCLTEKPAACHHAVGLNIPHCMWLLFFFYPTYLHSPWYKKSLRVLRPRNKLAINSIFPEGQKVNTLFLALVKNVPEVLSASPRCGLGACFTSAGLRT